MKKKITIIGIGTIVLLITVFGIIKYKEYKKQNSYEAPFYNVENKKIVVASSDNNQLNDKQLNRFYRIAEGAVFTKNKVDFTNLDDFSIYIEKVKEKGNYYIEYICENPILKMRFKSTMTLHLNDKDLRTKKQFDIIKYKSDFDNFMEDEEDY